MRPSFTLHVSHQSLSLLALSLILVLGIAEKTGAQSAPPARYLATYHVFPQFVDGKFSDGSRYRTTLMISNPSDTDGATCALQLRGLTLPGFEMNYSMGPGGSVISSTSGDQNFQSGYATLQCSTKVEPQLMYSYYGSDGTKISEAVTFSSPPAGTARLMGDERNGSQLGIAIANDSDSTASYTVFVGYVGASGVGTRTSSIKVGPRSSVARFLDQVVTGIPPNTLSDVQISSADTATTAIGLRFTGGAFAAMPEAFSGSSGPSADTSFVFPQFAEGKLGDGSYFRTFFLYQLPIGGTTCHMTTRGRLSGGGELVSFGPSTVSLPLLSDSLYPNSIPPLASGYSTVQCLNATDAQELLSYYDKNGVKLSEATVFPSPSAPRVEILADTREGTRVGLAIANDSDQPNTYTINLYDAHGTVVGTATQSVPARSNVAKFLDEFVKLPSDYYGPVIVSSSNGAGSILGIRFTGSVFTTIPEVIR